MSGHLSAYLVKNAGSGKFSLVIKGPEMDEKLLLFHSREVKETPYIAAFSYYIEEALPVVKTLINVANGTTPSLLSVTLRDGKFTQKVSYSQVENKSDRRIASVGNTTYYAYRRLKSNGTYSLGMNSDLYVPSLYKIGFENVEAFDLIPLSDVLVLVFKQLDKSEVTIGSIPNKDDKSAFTWINVPLDFLKESSVSIIRCSSSETKERFSCVFIGSLIYRVEFKLENDRKEAVIMKVVNFMPYKNMQFEDAVYLDHGIILVGRRSEITLNTTRRDQYGFMYYPLNVAGNYKEKHVFMVGGLDKTDLEKMNYGMRTQIKRGENDHSVILGSPETGYRLYSVQNPTVIGILVLI